MIWFSEKYPQQIGTAPHYISLILFPLLSKTRWDANFLLVHNQINPQPATGALNLVATESNIRERVNEVIAKMHKSIWRDEGPRGKTDGCTVKSNQDWPLFKEIGRVICPVCVRVALPVWQEKLLCFYFVCMRLSLCYRVPVFTVI